MFQKLWMPNNGLNIIWLKEPFPRQPAVNMSSKQSNTMKAKNHKVSKMLPKNKRNKSAQILPQPEPSDECTCPECLFRRTHPDDEPYALKVKGRPDLTDLKKHILKHAGTRFQTNGWVAAQYNADTTKRLINGGRFFPGYDTLQFPMERRGCHINAELLGADPRAERWMGFALCAGGWVLHSWVVRKKDKRVIETTPSEWLAYFGVHEPVTGEVSKLYNMGGLGNSEAVNNLFEGP